MLLVKYERFDVVAKDDFIEETLYKYEKNVGHFQAFDAKGRTILNNLIEIIEAVGSVKESLSQISEQYEGLVEISRKLQQLQNNQDFVYRTLIDGLNNKLNLSKSKQTLKEVYLISKYMEKLHKELKEDINNKIQIISTALPKLIFQHGNATTSSVEESISLLLDLWSYHNIVELK